MFLYEIIEDAQFISREEAVDLVFFEGVEPVSSIDDLEAGALRVKGEQGQELCYESRRGPVTRFLSVKWVP